MSILKRLEIEVPKRSAQRQNNPQYQAIRELFNDIKAAKERGYSWHQICTAVQAELTEAGYWQASWDFWAAQKFFYEIGKEAKPA